MPVRVLGWFKWGLSSGLKQRGRSEQVDSCTFCNDILFDAIMKISQGNSRGKSSADPQQLLFFCKLDKGLLSPDTEANILDNMYASTPSIRSPPCMGPNKSGRVRRLRTTRALIPVTSQFSIFFL